MAVKFNGTTQLYARTAALPLATAITICAWVRTTTAPTLGWKIPIAAGNTTGSLEFSVGQHSPAGVVAWSLFDGTAKVDFPNQPKALEACFLAVTNDGTTLRGYSRLARLAALDAVSTTAPTGTVNAISAGTSVFDGTDFFDGLIWEYRVWNRVLTAAELLAESRSHTVVSKNNLNLYWRMRTDRDIIDRSGQGRVPTVTGAPTTVFDPAEFLYRQVKNRKLFAPPAGGPADQPPSQVYYPDDVGTYEPDDQNDPAPYVFYEDNGANRSDEVQPPAPELPASFEWVDPNETDEALYPDYWAQPPPIDDNDVAVNRFIDADEQPESDDEDFGFLDAPLGAVVVIDQVGVEDADCQLEDEEEPFGFLDAPLPEDSPQLATSEDDDAQPEEDEFLEGFSADPLPEDSPQLAISEDSDGQPEEDEFLEGFADAPLAADPVAPTDYVQPELADNQQDDQDELEGFTDFQLPADVAPVVDQMYPETADDQTPDVDDEDYGFYTAPLADDNDVAAARSLDSDEQLPDEDEDFGAAAGPLADDAQADLVVVEDGTYQPPDPEDEDYGVGYAPQADDVVDLNIVWPEDASNQIDLPDDEAYSFSADPLPEDVIPPPNTGAHSGYLREVLIELYEREWEEERLKRERERAAVIAARGKLTPRVVRVKSVTVRALVPPAAAEEPVKIPPPIAEALRRADELALSITAQDLIGEAMTSLFQAEEMSRRLKAAVRRKRRAEEEVIIEFLIRNGYLD